MTGYAGLRRHHPSAAIERRLPLQIDEQLANRVRCAILAIVARLNEPNHRIELATATGSVPPYAHPVALGTQQAG